MPPWQVRMICHLPQHRPHRLRRWKSAGKVSPPRHESFIRSLVISATFRWNTKYSQTHKVVLSVFIDWENTVQKASLNLLLSLSFFHKSIYRFATYVNIQFQDISVYKQCLVTVWICGTLCNKSTFSQPPGSKFHLLVKIDPDYVGVWVGGGGLEGILCHGRGVPAWDQTRYQQDQGMEILPEPRFYGKMEF